ncbi:MULTISPECIES: hypothetical protein [unclassified Tolypothrix]|uniref:Lambda toxin-like protein n=1 Tax=Microchaete diplosiphon TaxID=1197 RepID=Q6GZZ3_MICDP|nr:MULTISPECIES: hypothetical protein [unclassified Tolypothrix]AAT41976.1 lambda toxin-like protein [Fremyella diplosiphon Fd33]BAY89643.1 hypothetical protein NIES3275_16460 [Microchaete diplosiphon NIES-3275]EKE97661.1 hypothetical protein FDUTEX481_05039 [Tolypothrix sp. PCC 7601]MBE9083237.1 hypothetical protein [Tolypothrix sp. LEGE 11397]UYD23913.1 hypothetical protein HGR01_20650 [Tolypothrix sp. PCC 7712]
MKIKTIHAHFLISTGNYSNERIGFSVELYDNDSLEETVINLRERAKKIVGRKAVELYDERTKIAREVQNLEDRLNKLRKEWDATAEFLKTQGLNPDAPSMPQFRNLLSAVTVESEVVTTEDDEDDDYDEDDEDGY